MRIAPPEPDRPYQLLVTMTRQVIEAHQHGTLVFSDLMAWFSAYYTLDRVPHDYDTILLDTIERIGVARFERHDVADNDAPPQIETALRALERIERHDYRALL